MGKKGLGFGDFGPIFKVTRNIRISKLYQSKIVCTVLYTINWIETKLHVLYRNDPKYSDTQKMCCNHSKVWTMWLYHRVMSPNDADGMANCVDPDQTAPLGAVWSGSALFAQACLSENLGSLRYNWNK